MKTFVINLATAYANMCDTVFAPSQCIADVLIKKGVKSPIHIVPTGVNLATFKRGSGQGFRQVMDIPEDLFLLGHIGRLAVEKNLHYLTQALIPVLQKEPEIHFLLVGTGPIQAQMLTWFKDAEVIGQVHYIGFLEQPLLSCAYQALDLFVFASKSETQGMVITEAMAASVPVIAIDAPGAREVVIDNYNGRLLDKNSDYMAYADALLLFIDKSQ
jgi:glycosyltransferase involved in cell wall biosynthesis